MKKIQSIFTSFVSSGVSLLSILVGIVVVTASVGFFSPVQSAFAATPAQNSSAGSNLSYNWAGYVSDNSTYTGITASWVVPSASASQPTSADATWVGIGGVDATDLIQTGTQAVFSNGSVTYQAWYETLPNASVDLPVSIKPGDSITASLEQVSSGLWDVSLRDNSTGQNASLTVNYNSSLSSAEWIEEMPTLNNQFLPLDNFGAVNFTSAYTTLNGNQVSILGANSGSLDMINPSDQALVIVSTLGSDGASFTASRTSAVATSGVGTSGSTAPYSVTYRITWQNGSTTRTGVGVSGLQRFHSFGRRASRSTGQTTAVESSRSFSGNKLFIQLFQEYNVWAKR